MDLYCRLPGEAEFDINLLETSNAFIETLQEITMLFETKPGDVLGQPDMGIDLERVLYEFGVTESQLRTIIERQVQTYIPQASDFNFRVNVTINDVGRIKVGQIDIILDDKLCVFSF